MDSQERKQLNALYAPLERSCRRLVAALTQRRFSVNSGWYSGHYSKGENGEWQEDSFPIPVIEVKGICDIEIGFDGISVSAKLTKERALKADFWRLGLPFQVYGVENYLTDYYRDGMEPEELREEIRKSSEKEIGVGVALPPEMGDEEILAIVKRLRRMVAL